MGLKNVRRFDLNTPGVFCDTCGKEIVEGEVGNAEWDRNSESGENNIYFVHAKTCGNKQRSWTRVDSYFKDLLWNLYKIETPRSKEERVRNSL